MPLMGIQLPVALVLAIVLRVNFMVMGGLQLITNPFTAAPVYYATHFAGSQLNAYFVAPAETTVPVPLPAETAEMGRALGDEVMEMISSPHVPHPSKSAWLQQAMASLVTGGLIFGLVAGLMLDGMDRLSRRQPRSMAKGSTVL
jgi:uncharacterized protein (DUF2062 family)